MPGCVVGIDKVGDILARTLQADADRLAFKVGSALAILGRDEFKGYLLTKIGDNPSALP